jgi:hypothetical protein
MNNATINRLILVLEIAAIILFHYVKSNSTQEHNSIVQKAKKNTPVIIQTSTPLLVHTGK